VKTGNALSHHWRYFPTRLLARGPVCANRRRGFGWFEKGGLPSPAPAPHTTPRRAMRRHAAARVIGGALRLSRPSALPLGSCSPGPSVGPRSRGFAAVAAPLHHGGGAGALRRWVAPSALRAFQARPYAAAASGPPSTAPTPNARMQDEFVSGTSAAYLESLEDQFREDPNSVPASWASLLRQMGASARPPRPRRARDRPSGAPTRSIRRLVADAARRARAPGSRARPSLATPAVRRKK